GPQGPALFKKLAAQGILVRERTREIGPGLVRISIGTASEMKRVVKIIEQYLNRNSARGRE
ncbi:MAG TPA: hypothetical protein VII37_02810, partial [Candidatus Acidoferrum sp.]